MFSESQSKPFALAITHGLAAGDGLAVHFLAPASFAPERPLGRAVSEMWQRIPFYSGERTLSLGFFASFSNCLGCQGWSA